MLARFSVFRPRGTAVLWLALVVVSLWALAEIPVDFFPKVEPPFISVTATLKGASPEQIEKTVAVALEERLKVVEGVDEIRTICDYEVATLIVKFKPETDLDRAVLRVKEQIEFARTYLPEEIQIAVFRFSSTAFPIMFVGVRGKRGKAYLTSIAESQILPALSRIEGVGGAVILADTQKALKVKLNPDLLSKYKISPAQVENAIRSHLNVSAGKIRVGRTSFLLVVKGEPETPEDIRQIVVGYWRGIPVKLYDVAEVSIGFFGDTSHSWVWTPADGKEHTVLMLIRKTPDANAVEVSQKIRQELERISRWLPPDIKVDILMDFSEFIRKTTDNLKNMLMWGVFAVFAVSLIFFRRPSDALIPSLSIPTSILFTILVIFLSGKSLNILTLSALIVTVGIVVDNSIVVFESIKRTLEERKGNRKELVVEGVQKVVPAIAGATLTTVVVFIPVIFVTGIAKYLFEEFSFVVVISVLMSFAVAITLVPALASVFSRHEQKRTFRKLEEAYETFLKKVIAVGPAKVVAVVLLISLTLSSTFVLVEKDFFPMEKTGDVRMFVSLPDTAHWRFSEETAERIKSFIIESFDDIEYLFWRYGQSQVRKRFGRSHGFAEAENLILFGVRLEKTSFDEAYRKLKLFVSNLPQVESYTIISGNPANFFLFGHSRGIQVRIFGDEWEKLIHLAERVRAELSKLPFLLDVELEVDKPYPQLSLVPNGQAELFGVTPAELGSILSTYISGKSVGLFRFQEDDIDIVIFADGEFSPEDIKSLKIPVKERYVSDVARMRFETVPTRIERINGKRTVTITADSKIPLLSAGREIEKVLERFGVEWEFAGGIKEGMELMKKIVLIFALVVFLVWCAMVLTLESFLLPFVIIFTIPLAFAGISLALLVSSVPFSVLGAVALVLLGGIVVNNGIVLLDLVRRIEEEKGDLRYAVVEGAKRRLRPVLITSLTTALSVVPALFGEGEGFLTGKYLAVPMLGGIAFSTVLTLILIPSLYLVVRKGAKAERISS